jgi:hypothetical protein
MTGRYYYYFILFFVSGNNRLTAILLRSAHQMIMVDNKTPAEPPPFPNLFPFFPKCQLKPHDTVSAALRVFLFFSFPATFTHLISTQLGVRDDPVTCISRNIAATL